MAKLLTLILVLFSYVSSVDFDSLQKDHWMQIPLTGSSPQLSVETHLAFDTSGYIYMLGGCAYWGTAGGTHNNDIYRFNIKTGEAVKLYQCGTNPWNGGCQAAQVYDPSRNCIWFGPGRNAACKTGNVFYPGLSYYGGLYKMQCPSGPIEKVRDSAISGMFFVYDEKNDLLIAVSDDRYFGCTLTIYDIKRDSSYVVKAPVPLRTNSTNCWYVPTCFDTKRGLVVVTRWGDYNQVDSTSLKTVWFYNTTTKEWHYKTPAKYPPIFNVPLVYEPNLDKYVLFGSTWAGMSSENEWHPQLWVYDYDSNVWTEKVRGSAKYDTTNRSASTWPPTRFYPGCFGYSPNYKLLVNWGGLWTDARGNKEGRVPHPIWAYKLGEDATTAVEKETAESLSNIKLIVSPSPSNNNTSIMVTVSGYDGNNASILIVDVNGRTVLNMPLGNQKVLKLSNVKSPGIYFAQLCTEKGAFCKEKFLVMH
ncbi:MAG: T9SS type A sorting domain-containing protein [Fibrobacteres bacterium]|nr:T9SS type A sorting domain-containing protein [Fibrobacterota bacterium]